MVALLVLADSDGNRLLTVSAAEFVSCVCVR